MLTLRGIEGPQGQLAIDDAGSGGLPVLFVHADGGNFTQWREALDHLRLRRRAIALALRGHGRSARPADGDLSVGGRSADIAAVVDALGLERFVLVGHSGGGVVALQYAAQHVAKVAELLLVDLATDGRQFPPDKHKQFMKLLRSSQYVKTSDDYYRSIAGTNPAVIERVLWDLHATPRETVAGTFEALAAYDPTARAAGVSGSTIDVGDPSQRFVGQHPATRSEPGTSNHGRHRSVGATRQACRIQRSRGRVHWSSGGVKACHHASPRAATIDLVQ